MLVGRDAAVRRIVALIRDAPPGPGPLRVVQLDGELGVGKSALLAAAMTQLRQHETSGGSSDASTPDEQHSYQPVLYLTHGNRQRSDAPLAAFRGLIEDLIGKPLERLLNSVSPPTLALQCIQRLDTGHLVLAVDDPHWLDPASMRFVESMMLAAAPTRVTLLVVYRFGEIPQHLIQTARRRGALLTHITVERLSDESISTLADDLPAHQRAAVIATSQGNPLFAHTAIAGFRRNPQAESLEEVLRSADERHASTLTSMIAADLEVLSHTARRTLEAMSVLSTTNRDRLKHVTGFNHDQLRASVQELAARGLLTDSPHETLHPVVRYSAYHNIEPSERAEAHRRAAHLPAMTLFERAEHLTASFAAESVLPASRETLTAAADMQMLVEAAQAAIGSEPSTVSRWLEKLPARFHTPETTTLFARAKILDGDFHSAIALLRELTDQQQYPEAQVLLANALRITDQTGEARALLAAAYTWAGDTEAQLLREYIDIVALIDGTAPDQLVSRLESLPDTEQVSNDLNRRIAAIYRTMTLLAEGEVPQARVTFQRVIDWLQDVTNDELASVLHAAACAVWAAYMLDQYQLGASLAERALQLARSRGQADVLSNVATGLAFCQASLGLLDKADQTAEQAIRDAQRYGSPALISMARAGLLISAQGRTDPHLLKQRFDELTATPLPEFGWWRRAVLTTQTRISALLGQPEPCPELLGAPRDAMAALRYGDAAIVAAVQGDWDTAKTLMNEGLAIADEQQQLGQRGMLLTAGAELLLRSGEPLQAGNLFRTACDIFQQVNMKLQLARAHAGLARSEAALAERSEPFARLTRREREIVQLVAEGARNPEIAERLTLSKRTVEYHVSNAMKKLDVQSRDEIAKLAGGGSVLDH